VTSKEILEGREPGGDHDRQREQQVGTNEWRVSK